MKNIIQRGVCLLLLLAVTAALSACGQSGAKNTIYAVEAGSAGEEVAKEKGLDRQQCPGSGSRPDGGSRRDLRRRRY